MDGTPFKKIESECRDRGLEISQTSIIRHAKDHIPGYKPRSELVLEINNNPGIPQAVGQEETVINPLTVESINIESGTDLADFARVTMPRVIGNQLSILISKQEQHMKGKGKHPTEEIKGLLTLVTLADKITSQNHNRKTIFDLDKGLDTTPSIFDDLLDFKHKI